MLVPNDEIVSDKIVGKLGNKTLRAVSTCGGFHLIELRSPDGSRQVVGAGTLGCVARMVAKKNCPDIEWTMLEKSEDIDERDVADILGFWEEVTKRVQQKLA